MTNHNQWPPAITERPLSESERRAALEADRALAERPLPYSGLTSYENNTQRQIDLDAAGRANVARAAGALGLTSDEWAAKRRELGRTPTSSDIKEA